MKNYNKPRWTDNKAIALTWEIIHLQDVLQTALGIGIREIQNQEYVIFTRVFLVVITRTVEQLNRAANEIVYIKRGPGKPPKWLKLAYDVEALTSKTLEAMETIKNRDIKRNNWEIALNRLVLCKRQFKDIQVRILRALPEELHPNEEYVSQQAILDVYQMARTLSMGDTVNAGTGDGWRNKK